MIEPMSDERLAEVRAKWDLDAVATGYTLEDLYMRDEISDLVAEIDRLRAEAKS